LGVGGRRVRSPNGGFALTTNRLFRQVQSGPTLGYVLINQNPPTLSTAHTPQHSATLSNRSNIRLHSATPNNIQQQSTTVNNSQQH